MSGPSSSSLAPTAVSVNGAACEVEAAVQAEQEAAGDEQKLPVQLVSVASARGLPW